MTDPALFGHQFGGESWTAWRALLSGFYGLELDETELALWESLTGGREAPQSAACELWQVVGRRGGKSQAAALVAVYEAAFKDHRERLAPGESATVRVMAADRQQARVVMRYVRGMIAANPMLQRMVSRDTDTAGIELTNRATIEVGTASFRTARGYSFAAVICDEIAFWRSDDSANPDYEILSAIRPGLATLDGKLLALSSPYSKRGELWEHYQRHFGQESPHILVAQAASRVMNPELPARVVDEAMARDPDAARAEYMGEFRTDVGAFVSREVVEGAARPDPLELPSIPRKYFAFADPAGGGKDEFTIAIGHIEQSNAPAEAQRVSTIYGEGIQWTTKKGPPLVVVDVVRARYGAPAQIVAEYAELLKAYGIREIQADRYAGSWPSDEFERHQIRCLPAPASKSDLYIDTLAALNSGRVELPPDDRTLNQFIQLERRTSRSGKDSIDHPPGGHDDRANAVAGLVACSVKATGRGVQTKPIRGLV